MLARDILRCKQALAIFFLLLLDSPLEVMETVFETVRLLLETDGMAQTFCWTNSITFVMPLVEKRGPGKYGCLRASSARIRLSTS